MEAALYEVVTVNEYVSCYRSMRLSICWFLDVHDVEAAFDYPWLHSTDILIGSLEPSKHVADHRQGKKNVMIIQLASTMELIFP